MIDNVAVNRAERMRWRAFNIVARKGDWNDYSRLVNLSLELPSMRDTSGWGDAAAEAPRSL